MAAFQEIFIPKFCVHFLSPLSELSLQPIITSWTELSQNAK